MSNAEQVTTSKLDHHRAIVAGSGIGRAVALRLASDGAKVMVNDFGERSAETKSHYR